MDIKTKDEIVQRVIKKLDDRSSVGYKKYGVTLHDDEPGLHKWLTHLQEELLDAANYIEKLQNEVTDVLAEKILADYLEEDSISYNPDPGDPPSLGTTTTTMYPGDIHVTYNHIK